MPNYVFNTVHFRNEDMPKVQALLGDGFDFNKIIPMPASLNIIAGSTTQDALRFLAGKYDELTKSYPDEGEKPNPSDFYDSRKTPTNMAELEVYAHIVHSNQLLYGYTDWYGWRNAKWGTKWNACEPYWDGNTAHFDTAWADPEPVFIELSKKLGITFRVECEEESLAFCSVTEYSNGEKVDEQIAEDIEGLILLGYTYDDIVERYEYDLELLEEMTERYERITNRGLQS